MESLELKNNNLNQDKTERQGRERERERERDELVRSKTKIINKRRTRTYNKLEVARPHLATPQMKMWHLRSHLNLF